MKPKLLIFDWDGTLRDSIAGIVGCARAALAEAGLSTTEAAVRATVGLDMKDSIERWCPNSDSAERERVMRSYRDLWISRWHRHGSLFSGIEEMLVELGQRGFLLAVATGKSRVGLERDFGLHEVRSHFHGVRTADESAAKPSPAMVLELMEELGAEASGTWVIGDTSHDLLMARAAGVAAVAVCCGAHSRSQLEELEPRACLERTVDLLGLLG